MGSADDDDDPAQSENLDVREQESMLSFGSVTPYHDQPWYGGLGFNSKFLEPDDDQASTINLGPSTPIIYGAESGLTGIAAAAAHGATSGVYGSKGSASQSVLPRLKLPTDDRPDEDQQSAFEQTMRGIHDRIQPDPQTTGWVYKLLFGLAEFGTEMEVGRLFGKKVNFDSSLAEFGGTGRIGSIGPATTQLGRMAGPAGAMAVTSAASSYASYHEYLDQGVDPATARKLANIDGGVAGAFSFLGDVPEMLLKQSAGTATRLLVHAAGNAGGQVGIGMANRYADHKILEDAGYPELAAQQKPYDGLAILTDLGMGLLPMAHTATHGAFSGLRQMADAAHLGLSEPGLLRDAVAVANQRSAMANTAPGIPVNGKSAEYHEIATRVALDQHLKNPEKPIDMSDAPLPEGNAEFVGRPHDPESEEAMVHAIAVHLREGGFEEELAGRDADAANLFKKVTGKDLPEEEKVAPPAEATEETGTGNAVDRAVEGEKAHPKADIKSAAPEEVRATPNEVKPSDQPPSSVHPYFRDPTPEERAKHEATKASGLEKDYGDGTDKIYWEKDLKQIAKQEGITLDAVKSRLPAGSRIVKNKKQEKAARAARLEELKAETEARKKAQLDAINKSDAAAAKEAAKDQETTPAAETFDVDIDYTRRKPRQYRGPSIYKDSLLQYFAMHPRGIDTVDAESQGIDPATWKTSKKDTAEDRITRKRAILNGRNAFRRGGMTISAAEEIAAEHGYLPFTLDHNGNPILDTRNDSHPMLTAIDQELGGTKVYSIHNTNRFKELEREHRERELERQREDTQRTDESLSKQEAEFATLTPFIDPEDREEARRQWDEYPDRRDVLLRTMKALIDDRKAREDSEVSDGFRRSRTEGAIAERESLQAAALHPPGEAGDTGTSATEREPVLDGRPEQSDLDEYDLYGAKPDDADPFHTATVEAALEDDPFMQIMGPDGEPIDAVWAVDRAKAMDEQAQTEAERGFQAAADCAQRDPL